MPKQKSPQQKRPPLRSRVAAALAALFPGRAAKGFNAAEGEEWHWREIGAGGYDSRLPGTRLDYATLAGDPWRNGTAAICLAWVRNALLSAPAVVFREGAADEDEPERLPDHPVSQLLKRPNSYYSGTTLWAGTTLSYKVDGNGYWLKERNHGGRLVGWVYLPHFLIEPKWKPGSGRYVDHYEYRAGADHQSVIKYQPEEIIHFRDGIDPRNTRKGYAPLKAALRAVFTDNEAETYAAALMMNLGVPGGIAAPRKDDTDENGDPIGLTRAQAQMISESWRENLTGDKRGSLTVLPFAVEVQKLNFSPEELALDKLRAVPEAKIAAAILGASAMVAGLPSGDDQKTYSNLGVADSQAWVNGMVPMMAILADDLTADLQRDGLLRPGEFVGFDLSNVAALQDDEKLKAEIQLLHAETIATYAGIGLDPLAVMDALDIGAAEALEGAYMPAGAPAEDEDPGDEETPQQSGKGGRPSVYVAKGGLKRRRLTAPPKGGSRKGGAPFGPARPRRS